MIEVQVKTLWQGKVGIRDRYVKEAIERKEGILIRHGQESMAIPFNKLKELIAGKSDRRFKDYFGQTKPQYLIYFVFRPQVKQGSLV